VAPEELTSDRGAFAAQAERHRRELRVHCYRLLGSYEESEDLVQETFLRAWRGRRTYTTTERGSFRAWLYRIATNACLDALASQRRRALPSQLGPPSAPGSPVLPPAPGPWLEPFPDRLLEAAAGDEPDAAVVAKETIELAFLAAIQLLPPRQRAVLILRDVLDWSAKDTAALLETSVASANSALQRARSTLRRELPGHRLQWAPVSPPTADERAVLDRYIAAHEQGDAAAFAALLRADARCTMPPTPTWFEGRDDMVDAAMGGWTPEFGEWRFVATGANLQPAAAAYLRRPGDSRFLPFALDVLRIEDGQVAEITSFAPAVFGAFELPPHL
jgi:RNA polymerase sigma-70 factor (ECF subfamily)